MRVFELARELEMTSKDLISDLEEIGIVVKNHMAALTDAQLELARREFSGLVPAEEPSAVADTEPATGAAAATAAPETAAAETADTPEAPPAEVETGAAPEPPAAAPEAPAEPEAPEAPAEPEEPERPKVLHIKPQITVKDFAALLGVKPNVLITQLMGMNIFATIRETIDLRTAQQLGEKAGVRVERERKAPPPKPEPAAAPVAGPPKAGPKRPPPEPERPDELAPRPPVVTFMGHVDHGKTSLLDFIRKTKVVAGEAGGITQHIGAYMVETNDRAITFIDTPGHAAFTEMRARGANLTDIAVIVVAADDGLMPQTLEAIQHAKAAEVTIMVAVNKMDLPGANMDQVLTQLQQADLAPEQWGGQTVCCPVSAVTGEGIDHLIEMIQLQAEVMELKANPHRKASGFVLEARLEPGMGPTATLLVRNGTLKVGDALLCGDYWGRVKALINDRGIKVRTAGPAFAIQCLGLTSVPEAGAAFEAVGSDREAKRISAERIEERRVASLQAPKRGLTLEDLMSETGPETVVELPVVVKADVQGTLEAIRPSLTDIRSDKVSLKIVLGGVGSITANDVLLAKASGAIILGFHVGAEDAAARLARREGVELRLYSVIYELVDDVRRAMVGLLAPVERETTVGQAEVKQVFELSKRGTVAGCIVRSGRATARSRARLRRGGETVYQGAVASLRRFQNDAAEVREGQECGIRLDRFSDYREGDLIEFFDVQEIAQEL